MIKRDFSREWEVGWRPQINDRMHHMNRIQNRNYMISPINAEKVFDRIQHLSS